MEKVGGAGIVGTGRLGKTGGAFAPPNKSVGGAGVAGAVCQSGNPESSWPRPLSNTAIGVGRQTRLILLFRYLLPGTLMRSRNSFLLFHFFPQHFGQGFI